MKKLNRRSFIQGLAGASGVAACTLSGTDLLLPKEAHAATRNTFQKLGLFFARGGWDIQNDLLEKRNATNASFYDGRPGREANYDAGTPLNGTDFRVTPALADLARMFNGEVADLQVAIVCAQTGSSRSHETSINNNMRTGNGVGIFSELVNSLSGADAFSAYNPSNLLAFRGALSINGSLPSYSFSANSLAEIDTRQRAEILGLQAGLSGTQAADWGKGLVNANGLAESIEAATSITAKAQNYRNTRLGAHMLGGEQCIAAFPNKTRVLGFQKGGFDNHGQVSNANANNLPDVFGNILTFFINMEARGIADEVLMVAGSEFGRTKDENGSLGTDHGRGCAWFVVGTSKNVNSGIYTVMHEQDGSRNQFSAPVQVVDFLAPIISWHSPGIDVEAMFPNKKITPMTGIINT